MLPRQRWILVNNNVLLSVWRRIFWEKLDPLDLEIDEKCVLGLRGAGSASDKGFICRKCKRSYESYNSAREKLLDNASNALKYINTTPVHDSRKRQRQEQDQDNPPAAKKPATMISVVGPSPAVQVSDLHNNMYNNSVICVPILYLQIHVSYSQQPRPRTYNLTPSRKRMGKAVARGSRLSIADECLNDEDVSKYVIKKICKKVQLEIEALCSDRVDSTLKHHSREELLTFKWSNIYNELERHTPILLQVLLAATMTRCPRTNREAVISMCAAMVCKLRRPQLSAAQKTLSLILYAGHASKQV